MISSYKLQEPLYTGQTLPVLQRRERDRQQQWVRASASLVALQTLLDTLREEHGTSGHPRSASRSTLPQPVRASVGAGPQAHIWDGPKLSQDDAPCGFFSPARSFHPCLRAKRSLAWVKICKALTRNTDISESENTRGKTSAFSVYMCHNIRFSQS